MRRIDGCLLPDAGGERAEEGRGKLLSSPFRGLLKNVLFSRRASSPGAGSLDESYAPLFIID